jgi:hypothetical protein
MISVFVVCALALFFICSVLAQCSRILGPDHRKAIPAGWKRLLLDGNQLWNRWRAIPVFTFFSYVPDREIWLLFRDRLCNQDLTPWKTVEYECNTVWKCFWNPDRRRQKAVMDLTGALLNFMVKQEELSLSSIVSSRSFARLITYTKGLPRTRLTAERQFMIAATPISTGDQTVRILFISPMSPIFAGPHNE